MPDRVHVVAAALLDGDARVLIQRRPAHAHQGGLWEFPGGKLEPGEGRERGLRREIHVSLDLKKLRALEMSVDQVVQVVQRENLNRPVGPLRDGRFEVLVRTQGEFVNLE